MSKNDPWQHIVKALNNIKGLDTDALDPKWILCYTDGTRNIALEHNHGTLDDVLQAFEDFCKGAGFVFDHFAIVDEDGIPVNGLNPIAKLESGDED
jgi:hypothetical protein